MSFYLTLPSNSSMTFHPDNTLTHYFTQLPKTIDVTGDWEVGLAEIQYPHSWYNIMEPASIVITVPELSNFIDDLSQLTCSEGYNRACEISKENGLPMPSHITIQPGYYTAKGLIQSINGGLQAASLHYRVHFVLKRAQHKITIQFKTSDMVVQMSDIISELLGLEGTTFRETTTSTQVVDINHGFCGLYVYCSVVEPQMVGDTSSPLLRVVPIKHEQMGRIVTQTYEKIFYYPLATKHFTSVEVDIREDTGVPVPFQRGKVVVTLHFRKVRKSLF